MFFLQDASLLCVMVYLDEFATKGNFTEKGSFLGFYGSERNLAKSILWYKLVKYTCNFEFFSKSKANLMSRI